MRWNFAWIRLGATSAWLAVAGVAAVTALSFPTGNGSAPGPAAVPLVLAAALVALSLLLLSGRRAAIDGADQPVTLRRPLALVGLMAGYVLMMPLLGFISASALFTMAVLRFLGYPHSVRGAALGLIAGFALYGFFAGVMGVPLPKGWLG